MAKSPRAEAHAELTRARALEDRARAALEKLVARHVKVAGWRNDARRGSWVFRFYTAALNDTEQRMRRARRELVKAEERSAVAFMAYDREVRRDERWNGGSR